MDKINYEGYFDYAAATPVLPDVISAMHPYFNQNFYNPSAIYLKAKSVKEDYKKAVAGIARELGCRPSECIVTAGGTEANNLAIRGVLEAHQDTEIIVSSVEHDSVLEPSKNYSRKVVGVDAKGFINIDELNKSINDKTVLVSVQYVNNEIGTIQPIKEVVNAVAEIRKDRKTKGINTPLYVHTDACQAVNYCDINVDRLGVDLMTINSGKIYGPKQCGLLYIRAGVKIKPQIFGGGQQYGIRSGTENVAYTMGFAKALKEVRTTSKKEVDRLNKLQKLFSEFVKMRSEKVVTNGPMNKNRIANNVHITIRGIDNERMVMELDELGFMVATGSACSASSDEPSHVLKAIGLDEKAARSSIRITMGQYTTQKDCQNLINNIIAIAKL
jgi:cysteine desulfurase